jgi:hypothetical protein
MAWYYSLQASSVVPMLGILANQTSENGFLQHILDFVVMHAGLTNHGYLLL